MIHAVYIDNGRARYKNCYVCTRAFEIERAAGRAVFGGIMFPAPMTLLPATCSCRDLKAEAFFAEGHHRVFNHLGVGNHWSHNVGMNTTCGVFANEILTLGFIAD